ncbi:MAG: hypothetical protein JW765_09750 [Deltaproteobacteria bacterium]|nr:hypothetical protein [Candidatus Zymogenaceae bacterium]
MSLLTIALIVKREVFSNKEDKYTQINMIERFVINVAILDKGLEYLKEIWEKRKS